MANLSNINNILRTGSLGVGINRDPLGAFEISSATKPGVKMFNTSTNGKTYEAYSDTNGNYIIYDQDADDNRFVINTSGNATFTGNVTANTGSKITSSSADTTFSIETTSGTTIFPILDFVSSHSSVGAKIRVSGTDVISLDKSQNATFAGNVTVSGTYLTLGGEGYIRSDDSGYLHFQGGTTGTRFFNNANNTALFTILNNGNATFAGNVGVGGKTPAYGLSLAQGSSAGNKIAWTDVTTTFAASIYANSSTDKLTFATKSASNVETTALEIDISQNATFAGTIQSDDITIVDGTNDINLYLANTSYGIQLDYSAGDMFFRTNGATRLTIANGGNVGIGTTSPQTNLHINNDTSNSYATLRLEGSNRGGIIDMYNQTSYPVSRILTDQSGNIYISTSGAFASTSLSEKFTILTGGNVGIGTTSPQYKLTVSDTTNNWMTRFENVNSENVAVFIAHASGYGMAIDSSENDSKYLLKLAGGTGGGGGRGSQVRMIVESSGNVGIGTSSPAYMLDVNEKIRIVAGMVITPTTSNLYATDGALSYYATNNGVYLNGAGPNGFLRLNASGNYNDTTSINIHGINSSSGQIDFRTANAERMRITSTGAISVGSSGTAYGAAGEVLTSNGNAPPSWQAAGGGGSAWPQEKFAEYTINSTTSNILVATMNSTTWHGNYLSGCLKFTMSTSDYVQVTYVPVSTFLSGSSKWFFKGTEMTSKNNGSNPAQLVFTFAGDLGTFGSTCTLKINRNQSISNYIKVNVLVQAISNPNMFILN